MGGGVRDRLLDFVLVGFGDGSIPAERRIFISLSSKSSSSESAGAWGSRRPGRKRSISVASSALMLSIFWTTIEFHWKFDVIYTTETHLHVCSTHRPNIIFIL